jgi:gamma-butyrobetaine dioxygenase
MDIAVVDGALEVTLPAGKRLTRHPIWLRERLPDPRVVDSTTGQRLIEAALLPLDLKITRAQCLRGQVTVGFSDGFEATIPQAWFSDDAEPPASGDLPDHVILWDSRLAPLPGAHLDALKNSEAALAAFLNALQAHGFAIVQGVPVELDGALDFAGIIGPIRYTNWGGLADVKAIPNAYDLTMTPRHLESHTDNPYRDSVPAYVLLHCLQNDATGGESTLVDGFHAATLLKTRDPAAFEVLTRTPVYFRYADSDSLLENRGTLIELDHHGRITQVRYSNRTELVEARPLAELDAFYRARRAFFDLIQHDPALTLSFKLMPGELMMMDNHRLLHGRRPYLLDTGARHMRQCYMDRDVVQSRRNVLNRRRPPLDSVEKHPV